MKITIRLFFLFMIFHTMTVVSAKEAPIGIYLESDSLFVLDALEIIDYREKQIPFFHSMGNKIYLPLHTTPVSVQVLKSSGLIEKNRTHLSEALDLLSGVNRQTGFGVHEYFMIRGFNSVDNSQVYTDGSAEPKSTLYHLYNIERVELLKGPSTFLYGGNPLSGTINLVRKQPNFKSFFNSNISYGQFNTFRSTIDMSTIPIHKKMAVRFNGLWEQSDNYRDDKDHRSWAINPNITFRPTRTIQIGLDLEWVESRYSPDAGVPLYLNAIPEVPGTLSYQTPFDKSEQSVRRIKLNYKQQLNSHLQIQNKFYMSDLTWYSKGTLLGGVHSMPQGAQVIRSLPILDDHQQFLGNQLELLCQGVWGRVDHRFVVGLEWRHYHDLFSYDIVPQIPMLDLYHPVEILQDENQLISYPYQSGDVSRISLAPYLMDCISISKKLKLLWGGRYDFIDYEDVLNRTTRQYQRFSSMTGLTYMPSKIISLYANLGNAFAPPSSRVVGDRNPEKSEQIESGIKLQSVDGRFQSSISVYQLKKDDMAIPDADGILFQTGNQRSRGIEFEFHSVTPRNILVDFNYTYIDAELTQFTESIPIGVDEFQQPVYGTIERTGNRPAFIPDHMINLGLSKQFHQGLGLYLGTRYISSQFIDEDNVFEFDSYFTTDASISFDIGRWIYRIHGKNLTNKQYYMRGFGPYSVIPAMPFQWVVELDIKL